MVRTIPLTQGKITLVDDTDYEYLTQFSWYAMKGSDRKYKRGFYAVSYIDGKLTFLHRLILNPPENMQGDHKNMNTLDNRRCNLRICTDSQNKANCNKYISDNFTSQYKGVSYDKNRDRPSKWSARICLNSISMRIGYFRTELEAALAYDQRAKILFGEFARTNFQ
jgi:hypothetical protein